MNGERSEHSVYGWGGPHGRVYQKAYVEFFVAPALVPVIMSVFKRHSQLSVYAVDSAGTVLHDSDDSSSSKEVTHTTYTCILSAVSITIQSLHSLT